MYGSLGRPLQVAPSHVTGGLDTSVLLVQNCSVDGVRSGIVLSCWLAHRLELTSCTDDPSPVLCGFAAESAVPTLLQ